jgi:uncharacterized protein (DUF58 family)
MLTDRGWAALGAGIAMLILFAALGEVELLGAGLLLVVGSLGSLLLVRLTNPTASVTRRLNPNLVHEGDQANRGRFSMRNVTVEDTVSNLGSARFALGKLSRGETASASYQILCRPRGLYEVGPARITATDPLGLATSSVLIGEGDQLIVYPSVEDLEGFPVVRGLDPSVHAAKPEFSHRGGEDFFTLREFRVGDDLRRVHWPSSAKRDQLMIRQLETPWQARALVMFDPRASAYESQPAFERAVRGAASAIRHLFRQGFAADLWAGGAPVSSNHASPYAAAMEALASVQPEEDLDIRAAATHLRRGTRGGALILITGVGDTDLLEAQRLLDRDFGRTILLSVSETTPASVVQFQRAGVVTITIGPHESWGPAWLKGVQATWSTV